MHGEKHCLSFYRRNLLAVSSIALRGCAADDVGLGRFLLYRQHKVVDRIRKFE